MSITTDIEVITPDRAAEYLKANDPKNRPVPTKVEQYARAMAAGEFTLNGEPIIFDDREIMIDGQTRCLACIKSGATFTTLVVRGIPYAARETIDTGQARTAGDVLHYRGVTDGRAVASVVRLLLHYEKGTPPKGGASPVEIGRYVEDNAAELDLAAEMYRKSIGSVPGLAGATCGVAYFLAARVDRGMADDFFGRQVIGGLGLEEGSPALALIQRLRNDATLRSSRKLDVIAYAIQAFNLYCRGERVSKLQAPHGGWRASNRPMPGRVTGSSR